SSTPPASRGAGRQAVSRSRCARDRNRIASSPLRQSDWRTVQVLHAGFSHQIIVLDADPALELIRVQPRLGGERFTFEQHVVPLGVEVRILVRLEAETVAE